MRVNFVTNPREWWRINTQVIGDHRFVQVFCFDLRYWI